MTAEMQDAVKRIAEVVMFENWLRFYFIAEDGDRLVLRLPEAALAQIKKKYGLYHNFAERLNEVEVNHQTSLNEVCLFVAGEMDGRSIPADLAAKVFDAPAFHLELQLFSFWVQNHEEQLDAAFTEFGDWQKMYAEWKSTDQVKEYASTMEENLRRAAEAPSAPQ